VATRERGQRREKTTSEAAKDLTFEKGLPANLDAERFLLGAIISDDECFQSLAAMLTPEIFAIEKHRRIFTCMSEIKARGDRIDRITLAEELQRHNWLEAVDGVSYVVSLSAGLPDIVNPEQYAKIVSEKATLRELIFLFNTKRNVAMAGSVSSQEIVSSVSAKLLSMAKPNGTATLRPPSDYIDAYPGGINTFLDPSKRSVGIHTGLVRYDEMTGGLHRGELVIIGARPGVGKSSLGVNFAQHVATNRKAAKPAAIFSLEMTAESIIQRMICASARVDQRRFAAGYLNSDDRTRLLVATNAVYAAPLRIVFNTGIKVFDIHVQARRMKQELGDLGLIVVDYLQLMTHGEQKYIVQELGEITKALKHMAGDLDVPVVALSQLNRGPEMRRGDHAPMLADLRQSGRIEEDADTVILLHRPELYRRDDSSLSGVAQLILGKNRNGPIGTVKVVFLKEYCKFENVVEDVREEVLR
jgi:replicative DNA helicase